MQTCEVCTTTLIHSCCVAWPCIQTLLAPALQLIVNKINVYVQDRFTQEVMHLYVNTSLRVCMCINLMLHFMHTFLSILQWPTVTLPQLISFKTRSGSNVLEQIGTRYRQIGILLLDDTTGTVTQAIIQRNNNDATNVILDIFHLWIQGKGRLPIKWTTFADVLRNVGLSELANEMVHLRSELH